MIAPFVFDVSIVAYHYATLNSLFIAVLYQNAILKKNIENHIAFWYIGNINYNCQRRIYYE